MYEDISCQASAPTRWYVKEEEDGRNACSVQGQIARSKAVAAVLNARDWPHSLTTRITANTGGTREREG